MTESTSLTTLLRAEQRARWQLGDRVLIEHYLQLHPQIARDEAAVLEFVWHELALRQEVGETPRLAEFQQRFTELADRLPSLFQMLQARAATPQTQAGSLCLQPAASVTFRTDRPDVPHAETVPGYEIVTELGRGGMGVVYLARQTGLKRLVALKMILAGAYADDTARFRFRTEAEAVARLQHPNIVQIYEVGEHDGRLFLSLEYAEGGNLKQKIAGQPMAERQAALLVEALAQAVHYTHQRGILHRDLNPNNVLLTAQGTPKITDFGLAKLLDSDNGPTRTEGLIGTPHYMSPEQAAGNTRLIGVPADVYSLGAILYELLTGQVPFHGDTVLNTLEQVRSLDPVPPRRLNAPLSRDLDTIALKCLEKEPRRRYANAAALADDLRRYLDGKLIHARPIPLWQRVGRTMRRYPAQVCAGVAALILALLLLTVWSHGRATTQLAHHRAEERYQQFLQRRNDANFYGLLTSGQGSLFLGTEAANGQQAAAAVHEALTLAGLDPEAMTPEIDAAWPASRQEEVRADSYALLLILANVRAARTDDSEGYQEALRILDYAERLGLQTQALCLRRAYFLKQLGQAEESRRASAQAAGLPLTHALDHFLIGEADYRRGRWPEAMSSFNRALALQPGHFWAQFFLAVCQLRCERWEAARAGFSACLTRHPDFVWAYLFRSFAVDKLQAPVAAEADFQKALQLNPNADARYVLFLTRGIQRYHQGEWPRAADDFAAARALKPTQYNAYFNLAQVQLAQGDFVEAERLMQQALRMQPPPHVAVSYLVERGRQLLRKQRYRDALEACASALELAPDNALPYEVRGRACLALQEYDEAETAFDRYLRLGGEPSPDLYRNRGLTRMQLGHYPEAAEDYSRALETAPDGELYQHRGWAHYFAEAYKLALRDFTKALDYEPASSAAYIGRGLAHLALEHTSEALDDGEEARRLRPDTPEMLHNLACIFAQASERIALDPRFADRQRLADRYRQRALDLLRETLQVLKPEERAGFWQAKVIPDKALASLRKEAQYQKWSRDYAHP